MVTYCLDDGELEIEGQSAGWVSLKTYAWALLDTTPLLEYADRAGSDDLISPPSQFHPMTLREQAIWREGYSEGRGVARLAKLIHEARESAAPDSP